MLFLYSVNWLYSDKAGVEGIAVTSNKTILGVGSNGTIKGKGLRIANGASNVIIQYAKSG